MMRKKLLLFRFLLVVLFSWGIHSSQAQVSVQIGNGTETPTNTGYGPFYVYSSSSTNKYSRTNMLYEASELAFAGIPSGATITKIAFYKSTSSEITGGSPALRFYMANSTATPPLPTSTTWTSILGSHTLVYENLAQHFSPSTGWLEFTLTTPFVYTGGGLEIASDWNYAGASTTDKFDWQYTTGYSDYIVGQVNTSSGPATLNGTTTAYKNRPNIVITYTSGSACTTTPNAGTSQVNVTSTVCAGTPLLFNLVGNDIGAGLTYEWESSVDDLFTTPVSLGPPSTSFVLNTVATSTLWYRCKVVCTNGGVASYSTPVQVQVHTLFPGGTYTIDNGNPTGGTNFNSFADAINAILCGIDGGVTFNVVPGNPYNEQVVIPEIFGASSGTPIIFNGNGATLHFTSTVSTERAGILLNGADYVVIKDLNIVSGGTTTTEYGFGIQLMNDADHNTVENCTITMTNVSTSSNYAGIVINGSATSPTAVGTSNCDSNLIVGNTIDGGYAGITLVGNGSTSEIYGNKVLNNTIKDFYTYGIYINGNVGSIIANNNISRPVRSAVSNFYAIYLTGASRDVWIDANVIHNSFGGNTASTSGAYGVNFSSADAVAGQENKVTNNLIYNFNGSGIENGIINTGSDYVQYYHNTIVLDNASATTGDTRGFYQTTAAAGIEFFNNIVYITRNGNGTKQAVYLNTPTSGVTLNNNIYYLNSPAGTSYFGYYTSNWSTLADWQSAVGQDGLSQSADPVFNNMATNDYVPTASIDNFGAPLGVLHDLNGNPRDASTPDVGCYEFTIAGCSPSAVDAGDAEASVSSAVCPYTPVVLSLNGNSSGSGQTYVWQSSPTSGSGFTDISTPSAIPSFSINPTTTMFYRAAVTCGSTTVYSSEVKVEVNEGLSGTYTIDKTQPTGNGNFNSFSDAAYALSCGVLDAVVLHVVPGTGPYEEQVTIPNIPGSSSAFTVTIHGNGEELRFTPTVSADRHILRLDGADHVIIDSLHIVANPSSTYGWGIHLMNGADSNVIQNCIIDMSEVTSTTQSNSACIVSSGSTTSVTTAGGNANANLITQNTLMGAYQGIILAGTTGSLNMVGNTISHNVIKDFYATGIELINADNTQVLHNDISRSGRVAVGTFAGVQLSTACINSKIESNKIHDTHNSATTQSGTAYGIYSSSCDAPVGSENYVVNNLIYNFNSTTGTQYAIYNSGSDGVYYYHNTISLDEPTSTSGITRGLYQTTAATNIEFKNNIVSITRGGTGVKIAVYKGTAGSSIALDNNVYYLNSAGSGAMYVGYQGGNLATLSDWQSTTAQDANSIVEDPMFADITMGDFTPQNALIDGMGAPLGVLEDIVGEPRSATNPDPGAYEFQVDACNLYPLVAGTATGPTNMCPNESFTLSLSGYTVASGITIQWEESLAGQGLWQAIPGATGSSYNVNGITVDMDYQARVTCLLGGNDDVSNTVPVIVDPFQNCYCAATSSSSGTAITNVTIRGTTLDNTTGASVAPYHEQYPASGNTTATLVQGGTYFLDLTLNGIGVSAMWIDFDQNGIFDTYEWMQVGVVGTQNSVMFIVPPTAPTGVTGMRIRTRTTTTIDSDDACANITLGETEDYLITIEPSVPCSGTPVGGSITAPDFAKCGPADVTMFLSGNTQESGISYQWEYNDNGTWLPISAATEVVYTANGLSTTQEYRVAVTCDNVPGSTVYSDVATVDIVNPQIISTTPVTRCGTGTADLEVQVSPGATASWFDNAMGGLSIGTGTTFTTPVLATTTDFYVAASSGGSTQVSSNGAPTSTTTTTNAGLLLEFFQDVIINSVDVYGTNAGNIIVELQDFYGNNVAGPDTFTLIAGTTTTPQTLHLNYFVPVGAGYRLVALSHPGGLGYSTGTFPVPLGNGVGNILRGCTSSLTSSTTNNYFFYNINTTAGCITPRIPVTVTVTPADPITVSPDDTICAGVTTTLSASSSNPDYIYNWTPGGTGSNILVTPVVTTEYYVEAVDGACTMLDTVVITVKGMDPSAQTLANPEVVCVSGPVSLSIYPEPLFGIDYQWQKDEGFGFTDITGATLSTYTDNISSETIYQLNMFCDGSFVGSSASVTVPVNNPIIDQVFDGERCGTGNVTLVAATSDPKVNINWYEVPVGGSPIATGGAFVTPNLTSNTTYYAAANSGFIADYYTVGITSTPERSYINSTDDWGIWFTTHVSCNFDSVGVYPTGTGTISILIYDQNNTQIYAGPVTNVSGTGHTGPMVMVPVGVQLPPGNYKIGKTHTGITNLGCQNIATIGYPFSHPVLTLTAGSQGGLGTSGSVYYYFYNWKISVIEGCESPRVPVTATVNAPVTGTGLAPGGTFVLENHADGAALTYTDPCSQLVVAIEDDLGNNVLGQTFATIVTPSTVQTFNGSPYVPRVYDITPSSDGPAMVTLYVLQSEFDAYNNWLIANTSPLPLLPTHAGDLLNAANIMITQYHSNANDTTTGPSGLYDVTTAEVIPNSSIMITPPSGPITYWTLKFPVSGFSGFFIHSGSGPLSIDLKTISAVNVGEKNRINWMTESETDGTFFELERSSNGINFETISSRIPGMGGGYYYTYWDDTPHNGINYYRLKVYDGFETYQYSRVVTATVHFSDAFLITTYPNPVDDELLVSIEGEIAGNSYIQISDLSGRIIKRLEVMGNRMQLDVRDLSPGVYMILYVDDQRSQTIRINKQ